MAINKQILALEQTETIQNIDNRTGMLTFFGNMVLHYETKQ